MISKDWKFPAGAARVRTYDARTFFMEEMR